MPESAGHPNTAPKATLNEEPSSPPTKGGERGRGEQVTLWRCPSHGFNPPILHWADKTTRCATETPAGRRGSDCGEVCTPVPALLIPEGKVAAVLDRAAAQDLIDGKHHTYCAWKHAECDCGLEQARDVLRAALSQSDTRTGTCDFCEKPIVQVRDYTDSEGEPHTFCEECQLDRDRLRGIAEVLRAEAANRRETAKGMTLRPAARICADWGSQLEAIAGWLDPKPEKRCGECNSWGGSAPDFCKLPEGHAGPHDWEVGR